MNVVDHPLHGLPKFGDGTGLHRVNFLMSACGIDSDEVARRAIAVTGSNGKGSTARITSELLGVNAEHVGLFTSPHLYRYNERFRIDGMPIDDADLLAAMDKVLNAVTAYRADHSDTVGAFEAQFVVALEMFLKRDCRWLVLEAGIGGRFDPVRCAQAPIAGLVSLDLEHTELLGDTLVQIACDKLDATAPGGIAILGETCLPFSSEIRAHAERANISVVFVEPQRWRDRGIRDGRQYFDIGDEEILLKNLSSALVGQHQINNHAVAIELAHQRLERSALWPLQDVEKQWREAISRVDWPGRLETISRDPLVVVDVGHTPEGIKAALQGFRGMIGERDALLVTGGSRNKHVQEMLEILAPRFDRIIAASAYHNGMPAAEISSLTKMIHTEAEIILAPTIEDAVARARSEAARHGCAIYVAGGLFLAAEFAESWRGGNPRQIRFF